MVKNLKNSPIVDFDSSKEPSWCTECNAKNLCSKKSRKIAKIAYFFRNALLCRFLLRAEVVFVAFCESKRFFWAIKIHHRTIFLILHHKGGLFLIFGGSERYTQGKDWSRMIFRGFFLDLTTFPMHINVRLKHLRISIQPSALMTQCGMNILSKLPNYSGLGSTVFGRYRVTYPRCHPPKKQSPRHGGRSWTQFFFFTPCLGLFFGGGWQEG